MLQWRRILPILITDLDDKNIHMEYPSKASAPPTLPDSFAPQQFDGVVPYTETWLLHFQRYADYRQMNNDDKAALIPLFLKDSTIDWYDNLKDEIKNDFSGTIEQFQSFFCKTALDHVLDADSADAMATRCRVSDTERYLDFRCFREIVLVSAQLYNAVTMSSL